MFFVDDNQPESGYRHSECRTGSEHHCGLAVGSTGPTRVTVCEVNVTMDDAYLAGEPTLKSFSDLCSQRYLGDKHQRLEIVCNTVFDECKVDFCLPTSCDTVQKKWGVGVFFNV